MGRDSSKWRVLAVVLAAGLVASIVLAPANAGNKTSVLGKTHTYITEDQIAGSGTNETTATCPSGELAVGGGINFSESNPSGVSVPWDEPLVRNDNLTANDAGKNPAAKGWRVMVAGTSGTHTYSVGVVCAKLVKVG